MRYSSCVLDIMHVLFTSSRPITTEKYFDFFLFEYYESLVKNLKNLGETLDFTYDELRMEFKKKIYFGVLVACLMFTCITKTNNPEELEPDVTDFSRENLSSESQIDKMYKQLSPSYHKRLRALFLALCDSNLI